MNRGKEALNEEVNSIVQNAVVSKVNDVITKVTYHFTSEFSKTVDGLADIMYSYSNDEFMTTLQNSARDLFNITQTSISQFLENRKDSNKTSNGTIFATVAAGAFGIITNIFGPIIEVLITLLPSILGNIFVRAKEEQKRQEIQNAISAQIPTIKREVRTKLSEKLQEQGRIIIEAISEKYDAELEKKKEEIEQTQKKLEENNQVNEIIKKLEACLMRIDDVLNQIL